MKIDCLSNNFKKLFFLFLFSFLNGKGKACQCALTTLGLAECNKYDLIFKGRITKVIDCERKYGEAFFEVEELYKGNATKEFKVLFECNVECAQKFYPGQEWIIYTRYKQIDNALMDWCSRSRMLFKIEKEDFYTVTYGNDYADEVKFLRAKLGVHRVLADNKGQIEDRNIIPSNKQTLIIFLSSIAALVLFYWLFNRFVR